MKFSLNFYEPDQLAKIARVNESYFGKAIDSLKEARKIRDEGKFDCGIYASSISFDGEQGEKMRALVAEIEPFVDEPYWLPLFDMRGASRASGMMPIVGNPGRLHNMREPLPCWSAFTEAHITKDGKLVACCFGAGLDSNMVMADLNEVGFEVGWNSKKFQELRESHLKKDVKGTPCEYCVAAR